MIISTERWRAFWKLATVPEHHPMGEPWRFKCLHEDGTETYYVPDFRAFEVGHYKRTAFTDCCLSISNQIERFNLPITKMELLP